MDFSTSSLSKAQSDNLFKDFSLNARADLPKYISMVQGYAPITKMVEQMLSHSKKALHPERPNVNSKFDLGDDVVGMCYTMSPAFIAAVRADGEAAATQALGAAAPAAEINTFIAAIPPSSIRSRSYAMLIPDDQLKLKKDIETWDTQHLKLQSLGYMWVTFMEAPMSAPLRTGLHQHPSYADAKNDAAYHSEKWYAIVLQMLGEGSSFAIKSSLSESLSIEQKSGEAVVILQQRLEHCIAPMVSALSTDDGVTIDVSQAQGSPHHICYSKPSSTTRTGRTCCLIHWCSRAHGVSQHRGQTEHPRSSARWPCPLHSSHCIVVRLQGTRSSSCDQEDCSLPEHYR
jgi:hypothetical protein